MQNKGGFDKKIDPIDSHAGAMLKKRRLQLGISQEELAKFVGVTFQQIQKYETGYNRISLSKLYRFCVYLSVGASYFFEGISHADKEDVLTDSETQEYEYERPTIIPKKELDQLCGYYTAIENSEDRKHILVLAKSIAARNVE